MNMMRDIVTVHTCTSDVETNERIADGWVLLDARVVPATENCDTTESVYIVGKPRLRKVKR